MRPDLADGARFQCRLRRTGPVTWGHHGRIRGLQDCCPSPADCPGGISWLSRSATFQEQPSSDSWVLQPRYQDCIETPQNHWQWRSQENLYHSQNLPIVEIFTLVLKIKTNYNFFALCPQKTYHFCTSVQKQWSFKSNNLKWHFALLKSNKINSTKVFLRTLFIKPVQCKAVDHHSAKFWTPTLFQFCVLHVSLFGTQCRIVLIRGKLCMGEHY